MRKRISAIFVFIFLFLFIGTLYAADLKTHENIAYDFTEIADDIYFAVGNGNTAVWCNSVVIVNENDVVVVDTSVSALAANALINDIKTLTDKPVGCVINTHYHFDHAHGNQVFGPEVEIIGHTYTREKLLSDILHSKTYRYFVDLIGAEIEGVKKQISQETNAVKRDELNKNLKQMNDFYNAQSGIKPTPPNRTFNNRMSIFKGDREIRLFFLGRGHTGGDIFVYLPEEKILCTGDFLCPMISYIGDAYVDEWDDALEKLKSIDFEVILPGHGAPMKSGEKIEHFQAYLRDLWEKTLEMRKKGATSKEIANKIDLTVHRKNYPEISGPGADLLAIERIYQLMELREKPIN